MKGILELRPCEAVPRPSLLDHSPRSCHSLDRGLDQSWHSAPAYSIIRLQHSILVPNVCFKLERFGPNPARIITLQEKDQIQTPIQ